MCVNIMLLSYCSLVYSVSFELQHNVCGRRVYAEGTADAVEFLHGAALDKTSEKRIYNMIDVLESGGMN
jgi:4-hydroxy-tetrahydrodipicolinate reductase